MTFHKTCAAVALAVSATFATPALAQDDADVVRAITRAQTLISTLEEPSGAARATYQIATTRLDEARAAQAADDEQAAVWRAKEAALNAQIAGAEMQLIALRERESELRDALTALRRELDR